VLGKNILKMKIKMKMKICLFFLAINIMLPCQVFAYNGDVKSVVLIDVLPEKSIYKQLWQPYIAIWKKNNYLVTYGYKLDGRADMGNIVCSITKDGGKNWTVPIMVFDHQKDNGYQRFAYANSVLFKPENQDIIWCFAMRCPLYYPDSEDSELCAAYTSDGGYSWTQVELNNTFPSPLITCAGIITIKENNMTKYLLPVHRNTVRHDPKGDREQFVLESTNLLVWNLRSYIPRPDSVWIHEGNIEKGDAQGELKIVMRTASYYSEKKSTLNVPRAYSSVSFDNGKTWSTATEESELYNAAAKGFFGKDSFGRYIYVYNDGPREDRKALWYVVQDDKKNWSKPKMFYFDKNRNSYATLIEKEPGVFLCVWDSSNEPDVKRNAIRFGILEFKK